MEPNKPPATEAELRKALDALAKEQPGSRGSTGSWRYALDERHHHQARLQAWSTAFKVIAFLWWVAGFVAIIAHIATAARMQRALGGAMGDMPNGLVGPSIVIGMIMEAVIVFAVGAIFWAISLVLVSLGHIEENTRPGATPE